MMLSIIVPVYNVKCYLTECVDSLLEQDYKDCEIILVDDGSTDGSSQLCDDLLHKDARLRVVHQKNLGLSAARNTGLHCAKGDYISFIDSDDLVSNNMFTHLIGTLEKCNADVSICNFEVFNRANRYLSKRYSDEVIDYTSDNQVKFFGAALDSSCNRIYRADSIKKINLLFEDKNIVAQEDYWFLVRLFTHLSRIVTVSACHYKYRERGSSITKSHSDGDITKRCLDFLLFAKKYISNNSDKEYEDFLNYAFVNMFMASINNVSNPLPKTIRNIVDFYFREPQFLKAISKNSINVSLPSVGLKHQYDILCFTLLRNKLLSLYSILESIRIKKLRSHNRTNLYFN